MTTQELVLLLLVLVPLAIAAGVPMLASSRRPVDAKASAQAQTDEGLPRGGE